MHCDDFLFGGCCAANCLCVHRVALNVVLRVGDVADGLAHVAVVFVHTVLLLAVVVVVAVAAVLGVVVTDVVSELVVMVLAAVVALIVWELLAEIVAEISAEVVSEIVAEDVVAGEIERELPLLGGGENANDVRTDPVAVVVRQDPLGLYFVARRFRCTQ